MKNMSDAELEYYMERVYLELEHRGIIRFYRNRRIYMIVMFSVMEIFCFIRVGNSSFHDYLLSGVLGLWGGWFLNEATSTRTKIIKHKEGNNE